MGNDILEVKGADVHSYIFSLGIIESVISSVFISGD